MMTRYSSRGRTTSQRKAFDANQLAKFIVDVAPGEREDATTVDPVTAFTQTNRRKESVSHAALLTPARRQEIAPLAAKARWEKKKQKFR